MKKIRVSIELFILYALLGAVVYAGGFGGGTTTISALATSAAGVQTTATSTNAAYYPLFVASSVNATQSIFLDTSGISYNPSTDILSLGKVYSNNGAPTAPSISFINDPLTGFYIAPSTASGVVATTSGNSIFRINSIGANFINTGFLSWSSDGNIFLGSGSDIGISRNGGGVLEVNDGTTPGALRDLKARAVSASTTMKTGGYTVATLPTGAQVGMLAYVTDAASAVYNSPVSGGGALTIPVFYNGSTWVSH